MRNARGKAFVFGDDVNTDVILPGKYLNVTDPRELASHCMESEDPDFVKKARPGDIMVARKNFGCGSSREHAPLAIIGAGIRAVVGHSFARIFYRNAFNMGLMLLEVGDEVEKIGDGDTLEISPEHGIIRDLDNGAEIRIPPLSPMMQTLIDKGGMVNYVREQLKMRGEAE